MDQLPTPPVRNRRRRLAAFGIFALLAVAAVLGYVLRPRPVPAPRIPAYTPQQAAVAQGHIETFRDELLRSEPPHPQIAAPAGPSRVRTSVTPTQQVPDVSVPARLALTEQDINTVLATNNALKAVLRSKGVQAVQVTLQPPDGFTIRAALVIRKRLVNAQIDGRLLPSPPALVRLVATRVQAGFVLLPPALVTAQGNKIIARFAQKLHGRLPFIVQSVHISNKTLVLTGVRAERRDSARGA